MANNYKLNYGSASNDNTGVFIAGAAGFGPGLLAAAGRKAAVQAVTYAAGDWFEGLKVEHKLAMGIIEAMQKTTEQDVKKRAALLLSPQHALGKHAVQEEDIIYCAMRSAGEVEGADELGHEHNAEVKQGLYDLERLDKSSSQWLPRLAELKADIEAHVYKEENEFFPALKAKLSGEENRKLTNRMNCEGFKVA